MSRPLIYCSFLVFLVLWPNITLGANAKSDEQPVLKVVLDSSVFDSSLHWMKRNLHVFISLGEIGNTQVQIATKNKPWAEFYGFPPGKYLLRVFSEVQGFWELYVPDFELTDTTKILREIKIDGQVAWHPVGHLSAYRSYDTLRISKDSLFRLVNYDTISNCFPALESDSVPLLIDIVTGRRKIFSDPDQNHGYVYVSFDSTNTPIVWGCSDYATRFGSWTYVDPATRDTCKFRFGGIQNRQAKGIQEKYLSNCLHFRGGLGILRF